MAKLSQYYSLISLYFKNSTMVLLDLSYTFSADDQSNWPGNHPFKKTVVSEGDDNAMSCFIAHVS